MVKTTILLTIIIPSKNEVYIYYHSFEHTPYLPSFVAISYAECMMCTMCGDIACSSKM